MVARKANENLTLPLTAQKLHANDAIVCKDNSILHVRKVRTLGASTKIEDWSDRTWTVSPDREITVRAEQNCTCNGSGVFRGGGMVENGVYKGFEGTCFGCRGKGWQDRADVIRNETYWSKYARIST